MIICRQSTARAVMVGPVLDADGVAVTDCVVADFEGSVNGGDPAALNGSATLTHRGVGFYSLALTATDLATVGSFEVTINDTTNACPMKELTVIEEAIYDALFAASANAFTGAAGSTTLTALASGSITAAVIATGAIDADAVAADAVTEIQSGLATAAALATVDGIVDDILLDTAEIGTAGAGLTNINLPNQTMDIVGNITGNLSGSVGSVGSLGAQAKLDVNAEADAAIETYHLDHLLAATYDPASKPGASDALLNELVENDGGAARYTANALEQAPTGGSAPTAAQIRTEIDDNSTKLAAIVADTNELQTDWVNGGRLDVILDARASQASVDDVPTNAELATALGAADDAVLAQVALVKAKTDNLPSDPADQSLLIAATDALATLVGDVPTNAELATALGAADDAVLTAVAAVKADTAAILDDTGTAGVVLSAATLNAAASALLDLAAGVEANRTVRQAMRLMLAALVGKLSGAATNEVTIRDTNDGVNRIVATVTEDGNRTAVTLNAG
jgi:hypothetical protein